MKRIEFLIALLLSLQTTIYGQSYVGYYSNPKYYFGFFKTRIALFEDSTFYYNFSGDMQFEENTGTYSYAKKTLNLSFKEKIDTVLMFYKDMDLKDVDTTNLPKLDPLIIDYNAFVIKKYRVKKDCLIPISDGKLLRKSKLIRRPKELWDNDLGAGIRKNASS